MESIIINSGYRERTRTDNKILLKNVPISYTYDGRGCLRPKDDIEKNIKRILCSYNSKFKDNLERVELILIKPRNEKIRTVYHNAKLIFKRTFDIKELCNKTIKIGFIESLLNEWKSKNDLKYENEPFLYAVMQTCNYCGSCEHDIWGCPRYVELRKQEELKVEQQHRKESDEFKTIMRRWRPRPICNICSDLERPHKHGDNECKDERKCINCGKNDHCSKDYKMCSAVIKQMIKIQAMILSKYGENWRDEDIKTKIRNEYPNGIGNRHFTVKVRERMKYESKKAKSVRDFAQRIAYYLKNAAEKIDIIDKEMM